MREKLNTQAEEIKKGQKGDTSNLDANLMALCDYLVEKGDTNADFKAKVVSDDKSLKTAFEYIKENARKLAVSNCAMVRDDVVFGWLEDYYNRDEVAFKAAEEAKKKAAEEKRKTDAAKRKATTTKAPEEEKPKEGQISLMDLL